MSEDEGQPRPIASRRQVWRMTRHHLVPLAAMGVAAAESVAVLCDRVMVSDVEVARLRPKVEGQLLRRRAWRASYIRVVRRLA